MLSYVNSIRQNLWKLCRSCFALREAVQLLEILLRILEKNQNILKFAKTVIFIEYYYYSSGRCSVLPPPRLGGVGILVFFGGEVSKYFWYQWGVGLWGIYISFGEVSSLCVYFPILECKIWKYQKFSPVAPSFSIFTFSDLRYMQCFK